MLVGVGSALRPLVTVETPHWRRCYPGVSSRPGGLDGEDSSVGAAGIGQQDSCGIRIHRRGEHGDVGPGIPQPRRQLVARGTGEPVDAVDHDEARLTAKRLVEVAEGGIRIVDEHAADVGAHPGGTPRKQVPRGAQASVVRGDAAGDREAERTHGTT